MVLGPLKFSNRIAILGDFVLIFGYFFSSVFLPSDCESPWMLHLAKRGCRCLPGGRDSTGGKRSKPYKVSNFQMQITCHNSAENKSFIITIL